MFYENTIKTKKTTKKTLTYNKLNININTDDDASIMPENQTTVCYNFNCTNGILETGYGFSSLKLPVYDGAVINRNIRINQDCDIKKLWHFKFFDPYTKTRQHKLMWFNGNGYLATINIFTYDSNTYEFNSLPAFADEPVGANYRYEDTDFMLFSYDAGMYSLSQNVFAHYNPNCAKFVKMCVVYNNLFAILEGDRNSLFYSSNLNPTTWQATETKIDLTGDRGSLCSLINFNDYLYIFRDFGITKVSKYSVSGDFSVSDLFQTSSKIFGETVTKCGDTIVFLSKNGLYSFNGSTTKKYNLNISKMFEVIDNNKAVACFNNGKYFVACRLNFFDTNKIGCENVVSYKNNALLSLDLETNELVITRGVDINSILSLNEGSLSTVIASFYNEHSKTFAKLDNSGKIFDTPLNSQWSSTLTNLDCPEKLKLVKQVIIKSYNDCVLTIKTDLEEKSFNIVGSSKIQKIKVFVKGYEIQTQITSSGTAKIFPPKLVLEVID
ncbi:MAG: hypothetical protein PHQ62_02875 [Clostridia bacterium]|nr:hypothetical protein [Clostridia bacterium]